MNEHRLYRDVGIYQRVGHVAVGYKHYILVWGGFKGVDADDYCSTEIVLAYNSITEVWNSFETSGQIPRANSGSTGLVLDDGLYIFGGAEKLTEEYRRYTNSLVRLDLISWKWRVLAPGGEDPLSCDKGVGWVYENKLYFFGGYGQKPTHHCDNYAFVPDTSRNEMGLKGWNNQLVCYNPSTNSWEWVKTRGKTPPPRAAHSCDIVGPNVYLFGGRLREKRTNDMYILDMQTMQWSLDLCRSHQIGGLLPEGMSWNSMTCVSESLIVLYGGLNQIGKPVLRWWLLRIHADSSMRWEERPIPQPLMWHKAVFCRQANEIVIIGGVCESPFLMNNKDYITHKILLQLQPPTLLRNSLNKIVYYEGQGIMNTDFILKDLPHLLHKITKERLAEGYKCHLEIKI